MPNKDINKRRENWRRWYAKNKSNPVVVQKRKARALARWSSIKRSKCSIDGCLNLGERHHENYSNPKEIVWLCKFHHESLHRNKKPCDLCEKPQVALGLCFNHWRQQRRKKYGWNLYK